MSLVRHRGGSGEPLVLIHGVASSWRDWVPVLPALERRFEVLALALPGHADAPPFQPGVTPGVRALSDAVAAELDRQRLSDAHVAGNSLGGWIALELARRGRARSVAALAPAGLSDAAEARALERAVRRNRRLARLLVPLSPLLARSRLATRLVLAGAVREPERVDPREAAHKLRAFATCPEFDALVADLCRERAAGLEEIRCPVLIVWGERDRRLPAAHAERFAARIPHARVARLPEAGHLPMWDEPELVATLFADFALAEPVRVAAR